jgi:uncharacterized protein (DUF1330 family)
MKYYAVAEIDITDPSWVQAYIDNVTGMVKRHGGRYLARTARIEKREGDRPPPQIFLIIEWSSKAAADAFYASTEYRPYLEERRAGAKSELIVVAGEDTGVPTRIS